MAISNQNTEETNKPRTYDENKTKDKKERPLTKIVVRRLPPSMTQEEFLTQVSPIPDYDYLYTMRGDTSWGEHVFSRVYINFVNIEDVFTFKEKFDNYVFVNEKGHEYPAVVEFALFQKMPKKRKVRPDVKAGVITSDSYYLEFLESLKESPNVDEKPEFSYQFTTEKNENVTTPLLEYVKQKRINKQRIRDEKKEERRRRDLERKKIRDDEHRKHMDDKLASKSMRSNYGYKSTEVANSKKELPVEASDESQIEKNKTVRSAKDQESEDTKLSKAKSRAPPHSEKYEYKYKHDDYKGRGYRARKPEIPSKKDPDPKFSKRVKKYSEKREERKLGIKNTEQTKTEQQPDKKEAKVENENDESKVESQSTSSENVQPESNMKEENINLNDQSIDDNSCFDDVEVHSSSSDIKSGRHRDGDPRVQRRIKNKDRPTMAIYQPGMLSKRRHSEDPEPSGAKSDT